MAFSSEVLVCHVPSLWQYLNAGAGIPSSSGTESSKAQKKKRKKGQQKG